MIKWFILICLFFCGCSTTGILKNTHDDWRVTGAFSATCGKENNTARFLWRQNKDRYDIDIFEPMNIDNQHFSGSIKNVASTKDLPIKNLSSWMFARPATKNPDEMQFDEQHHLISLREQNWQINYSKFISVNNIDLPSKITLQNSKCKIKIVIDQLVIMTHN